MLKVYIAPALSEKLVVNTVESMSVPSEFVIENYKVPQSTAGFAVVTNESLQVRLLFGYQTF